MMSSTVTTKPILAPGTASRAEGPRMVEAVDDASERDAMPSPLEAAGDVVIVIVMRQLPMASLEGQEPTGEGGGGSASAEMSDEGRRERGRTR